MTITAFELDALKPKDKPYLLRERQRNKNDGTLAFKVLPSGDIDAYFIYYIGGKEKQKKIGRYGKSKNLMNLKAIRDEYTELSKAYQQNGGTDIKEEAHKAAEAADLERQKQAALERKRMMQGSFQQLIDLYLEFAETKFSATHLRSMQKAFEFNLKGFDTTKKANEITKDDIKSILNPIINRGSMIMANRMRAYLSAMFQWGVEYDDDTDPTKPVQFYIENNPVSCVKKPLKREEATDRFLNESEVHTFWHALDASQMSIHRGNVLKLMLALGCRVKALTGLRWNEIDFNERLINIPPSRSKNGLHWVIPLNNTAFAILSDTPRLHDELVFPAENGVEPLRDDGINQAVTRLCEQAGLAHFTPRDLRSTFKTLAGKAGLSKDIRDRLQNHALTDVSSKHYDRYDYLDEKRRAMDVWNNYLQRILSGGFSAQVIPFKKAV